MNRYDRQIILPEIGPAGQERIRRARVLLVGAGGLGSPVALYLVAAGVGCLGIVDGDLVDRTNLQRQVLYTEADLGLPKATQASRRLKQLNRDVDIHAYPFRLDETNAHEIISSYDLVVDGCDNFATRYLINDICMTLGRPYIYGAIRAFDGQVAVFNHPQGHTNYRTLYPDEEQTRSLPSPSKGVLGVTPGIVGCVEATETLKLIAGFGEPLIDKLWTIDLRNMQSYVISL